MMDDERPSSDDHQGPSVGPRIQISDDQRQTVAVEVDKTADSDSIAAQQPVIDNDNDNANTRLHVPVSVKGHSLAH